MKQVIVCDDDHEITESISIFFKNDGYKIFECHNGKEAINCLKKNHIDLIIMDIMMPGEDGIKTVSKIREESSIPVIFLSARSEDEDKIKGLTCGGDDYVTKPFNLRELKARVQNILKRSSLKEEASEKKEYKTGSLRIDPMSKKAFIGAKELQITPIEYKILLFLLRNVGKVLSSNDIYKEVWNESEAFNIENTVAVHIRHLRRKIEKNPRAPKYIKVVWGIGYKMETI